VAGSSCQIGSKCCNATITGSLADGTGSIVVTQAESGCSYDIASGDRVTVDLTPSAGLHWSTPTSSDPRVLAPVVDTEATPVQGAALAAFGAGGVGQAYVEAAGTPVCGVGTVCPMYVVAIRFTFVVAAPAG
jgi:hypothetical protein